MKIRSGVSIALLGLVLFPTAGAAQSLLSSGGLGFRIGPLDGRTRAMGGQGVGLLGASIQPFDPTSIVDMASPEVAFTFQQSWIDIEGPAVSTASASRFPIIGLAYPVRPLGVISLSFATVLDQRYQVELQREIEIGGETLPVTDGFLSEGGVSTLQLGFARRVSPNLALGLSVGRFTGEVRRVFTRSFDSLTVATTIPDFSLGGVWGYSGPTVTGGAQLDIGSFIRAAGSVTWSGTLSAEPIGETEGAGAEYSMPMEMRVGASGALSPDLNLVVGMSYSDWSDLGDETLVGKSTLSYGFGFEWEALNILTDSSPLRFGFRKNPLPFGFRGAEADETLWTGGLGLNFAMVDGAPRASVDLAIERGNRSGVELSERFWRSTLSLRIAGF